MPLSLRFDRKSLAAISAQTSSARKTSGSERSWHRYGAISVGEGAKTSRSRITSGPLRRSSARSARHPRKARPVRASLGARQPRKKEPPPLPAHHQLPKSTHRKLSRKTLEIARTTEARRRPKTMTATEPSRAPAAAPKHTAFAMLEQRELRLEACFPSKRVNPLRWLLRGFVRKHERSPMNGDQIARP